MAALSCVFLATSTLAACGQAGDYYGAPGPSEQIPDNVLLDPVPVTRVIDGDTFEVELDGVDESIRMKGIDTPELNLTTPANDPEPCAEAARAFSLSRIGTVVELQYDSACGAEPSVTCRDTYGRLLAYVRLGNGSDLAALLLRAGLARVYQFRGEEFDRLGAYDVLEGAAQADALAIWGAGCP